MMTSRITLYLPRARHLFGSSNLIRTWRCQSTAISAVNLSEVIDKKLFTPGPLGVSTTTKQAMLRDVGSRDTEFVTLVRNIRDKTVQLAGVSTSDYTCVPMQGSGTFAIEAVLTTAVPVGGKVLLLENGAYGKRQAKICSVLGIEHKLESFPEDDAVSSERVYDILNADPHYNCVSIVHCETSSGVVNPIEEIGAVVKDKCPGSVYFVDAMSSFGAIPIDMDSSRIDYLVSSANKCLQGVPAFSFAIARTQHLLSCKGNARSYCLDLVDQYIGLESNGQFRFTPPTHAMLAFQQALTELDKEGGIDARSQRYQENRQILRDGMSQLGFTEFLNEDISGYIITSYNFPTDDFNFIEFYQRLADIGQVIYPGKVLDADCFRIGNIGHLFPDDMTHLVSCIEHVCQSMKLNITH